MNLSRKEYGVNNEGQRRRLTAGIIRTVSEETQRRPVKFFLSQIYENGRSFTASSFYSWLLAYQMARGAIRVGIILTSLTNNKTGVT